LKIYQTLVLISVLLIAGCGGGTMDEGPIPPANPPMLQEKAFSPLALSVPNLYTGVPPPIVAEQLFNRAQVAYPAEFPGSAVTHAWIGTPMLYRCYINGNCIAMAIRVEPWSVCPGTVCVESGVYAYVPSVFGPRIVLVGRALDFIGPVYPATFALHVLPEYPLFAVSGQSAHVRILVDASHMIRMAPNRFPWGTIGITGGVGLSPAMTFTFTPDQTGLYLDFTGSRATNYTATFTLSDLSGAQATVVVPVTTP
jgi:hypothetical protein